jgi:hypothetical protein
MKRSTSEPIDGGSATSLLWDKYSGGNKVVNVAPELIYVTNNQIKEVGPYETLHVYNDKTNTSWLYLRDSAASSSIDPTNLRPLPPKSWSVLNNGIYTFISSDTPDVYVYKAKSDSKVQG